MSIWDKTSEVITPEWDTVDEPAVSTEKDLLTETGVAILTETGVALLSDSSEWVVFEEPDV